MGFSFALISLITAFVIRSDAAENVTSLSARHSFWFTLPKTLEELRVHVDKYVWIGHLDYLNVEMYSLEGDPKIILLFDKHGNIGGIRHGYIIADVGKQAESKNLTFLFSFEDKIGKFYRTCNHWNTEMLCADMLFTTPETLVAGGRSRLVGGIAAEGVWFFLDGEWVNAPSNECEIQCNSNFVKQGCLKGMGMHYVYKLTETTACEDLASANAMYEDGRMVGAFPLSFGYANVTNRAWFDRLTLDEIKTFLPYMPPCLLKWAANFGIISMHSMFTSNPANISCDFPHQDSNRCINHKCSL